jgi:RNA polymerase sigma factor (sigma-70 family)
MTAEFEACVAEHRGAWMRIARRYMMQQDAEDVVQETIFRGWRGLSAYKGECVLAAWMARILRNAIYDRRRSLEGKAKHVPLWGDEDLAEVFLPEVVTRAVLYRELLRMLPAAGLTRAEKDGIASMYRQQRAPGRVRQARHHGIVKLRGLLGR